VELALICKKSKELIFESNTAELIIWRSFAYLRFDWLRRYRKPESVSWRLLVQKFVTASSAPIFSQKLVLGCTNAACPMYDCPELCDACSGVELVVVESSGAEEFPQHCIVKSEISRAIKIALWLYGKGEFCFLFIFLVFVFVPFFR
jgi:hypothetical protein